MEYKVITNPYGVGLMEHIIGQGLLNNGFKSEEELKDNFPDTKLNITYINKDKQNKIYAIKNTKTNQIVSHMVIKYFGDSGYDYSDKEEKLLELLDLYKTDYEYKLSIKSNHKKGEAYRFMVDNPPEDLKVTSYYIIEE